MIALVSSQERKWLLAGALIGLSRRYFSLKSDGSLAYYKSAHDTDFGCRGAISIQVGQKRSTPWT